LLFMAAATFEIERIHSSFVGEPHTINSCGSPAQDTDDFTNTFEVYEFPPNDGQLPVDTYESVGEVVPWDYTPRKAGMYWIRARTCQVGDGCSPWVATVEVNDEVPGCVTNPLRHVYYFELPAPTEGGIE
ncbi:MAG: hypothetical protein ACR2PR_11690, partial [Pseudohongiellaceae bacterium]